MKKTSSQNGGLVDRRKSAKLGGAAADQDNHPGRRRSDAGAPNARCRALSERKTAIDHGIGVLETAVRSALVLQILLVRVKRILAALERGDARHKAVSRTRLRALAREIQATVNGASCHGINLLASGRARLTIQFSPHRAPELEVWGRDCNVSAFYPVPDTAEASSSRDASTLADDIGDCLAIGAAGGLVGREEIDRIEQTLSALQVWAAELAAGIVLLRERVDFTRGLHADLGLAVDRPMVFDLNENGAWWIAQNTRRQLGAHGGPMAGPSALSIVETMRPTAAGT